MNSHSRSLSREGWCEGASGPRRAHRYGPRTPSPSPRCLPLQVVDSREGCVFAGAELRREHFQTGRVGEIIRQRLVAQRGAFGGKVENGGVAAGAANEVIAVVADQ